MIVEGTHTFDAPIARVWDLLLDPDVMVKAMPGAKDLKRTADDRFEGVIKIGVGPITAAEFSLVVSLKDMRAPNHYGMQIDSTGRFGFTRGEATVDLASNSATTTMTYKADLNVGGKIAGVGQRLLDSISKMMTRQGLDALSAEIEKRLGGPQPPAPSPQAPS